MIKIVLCDDDSGFLSLLQKKLHTLLKEEKQETMVCIYESPSALSDATLEESHIFFLDMDFQKEGCSGIDLARRIRQVNQDAVLIFVTNYVEYAPEGYEVQAFRYLLKSALDTKLPACLRQALAKLQSVRKTVQLSAPGDTLSFSLSDIEYIESQGHAALIHITDGSSHRINGPMTALEDKFRALGFLRVHKSYLVNMERIAKYQHNGLVLDSGALLPVSQRNYAQLKQLYLQWKGRC